MTANERLEKLLNRAGQTISDLPQNHCGLIGRVATLVDIIDRMETALENVIGERDWLRANYSANPYETVPEDCGGGR